MFHGSVGPATLHESTPYMSVIPTEVEGSRPVLGVHARLFARPRQPGGARGSRLRAVDGARSLHFGRDVNTELNCHFFADADVPRLTNSNISRARHESLVARESYAVPPPDDLAESRAGAAVFSGACVVSPARRFSLSLKLSPLILMVLE